MLRTNGSRITPPIATATTTAVVSAVVSTNKLISSLHGLHRGLLRKNNTTTPRVRVDGGGKLTTRNQTSVTRLHIADSSLQSTRHDDGTSLHHDFQHVSVHLHFMFTKSCSVGPSLSRAHQTHIVLEVAIERLQDAFAFVFVFQAIFPH